MIKIIVPTLILCVLISCNDNAGNNATAEKNDRFTDSILVLKKEIDSLYALVKNLNQDLHYWFSETEIDDLKERGIADPEKSIVEELHQHPGLIPYEAVLGGTMRYWNITLLRNRWAIASFEDGHIGGSMLLKYAINKDSSIKWTVIDHIPE